MVFEFDVSKSKIKHGIDFVDVQKLWGDENCLEIPAPTEEEPRYVLIAVLRQTLWSAFFTYRKEQIRLSSVRRASRKGGNSTMNAKNLEKLFDEGRDVIPHLTLSKARRPGNEQRRVSVDFPNWIIESLDVQTRRLGATRPSLINRWIAERLKGEGKQAS